MKQNCETTKPRDHETTRYTLFGRRKGRRLRAGKSALLETLLPRLAVPVEGAIDLGALFGGAKEVWLEIGFGGGEHLAALAKAHPGTGFIGCEPFVNGVAGLLDHIARDALANIRIHPDDARQLIERLPDASITRCFVLFPDPWPKKRHASRRFIGPDNLPQLARILKSGGELRIASDDPPLQDWMEAQLLASPDFVGTPGCHPARPESWPRTRYEEKALAKKKYNDWWGPRYYSYKRR